MYPISTLVRRTFYQDKAARQRYLAIAGGRRPVHALNHLSRQIEKGELHASVEQALLTAGISEQEIAQALKATAAKKHRDDAARFVPRLYAVFTLVPREQRKSNVPYFQVGAVTNVSLPRGIAQRGWEEQLAIVKQCIEPHRTDFYRDSRRALRDNYFGDIQEYHYEPAADVVYRFSPAGAQFGK